jgi:hypothetical protein
MTVIADFYLEAIGGVQAHGAVACLGVDGDIGHGFNDDAVDGYLYCGWEGWQVVGRMQRNFQNPRPL